VLVGDAGLAEGDKACSASSSPVTGSTTRIRPRPATTSMVVPIAVVGTE
jgi:hypothetical protein